MERPNKIVISGYYGFDNLGDEAVLSAILSSLKEAIRDLDITVLSNNPERTKAVYGIKAVNRWQIKEVAKALKACDMLISGGGSLLQDVTSSKTIPYYLGIVMLAKWYKKKVVFYSQGIGPVNYNYNKWLIKQVTNGVDAIFVREQKSREMLQDLGIKKEIIVAADPVLGIKPRHDVYKYVKDLLRDVKAVGVYIRPWQNEEAILKSLEEALKHTIDKGYKIYLIPMYYAQDCETALKLKERLGDQAVVIDKMLTIDEVVSYTAAFEFVIGMRLHSLIMAAAMQVPMIGISYDPKVRDFMKEMQIPYCLDAAHINSRELTRMIEDLISHQEEQKMHLSSMYKLQMEKVKLPAKFIKEQLL